MEPNSTSLRVYRGSGKMTVIQRSFVCCCCLLSGCVSTSDPIEQPEVADDRRSHDYMFCGMSNGVWRCDPATIKTPVQHNIAKHSGNKSINQSVRNTIRAKLEEGAVSRVPAPGSQPIAIIYFEFNSSYLSGESEATLVSILEEIKGGMLEVYAYTDNYGSKEYNNWLGSRRAERVKVFLEQSSADVRIKVFSGDPCCSSKSPGAGDRRVEVYLNTDQ